MKISHLLFVFSILFLVACGDSSSEEKEMLLGGWDLVQLNGDGVATTIKGGETTELDIAVTSGDVSYVITFTEGSYVTAGSYNVTNEKIDASGIKVFEPLIYTNATGNGTYSIDDKALTTDGPFIGLQVEGVNLGIDAGQQMFTIESVNTEELIFSNTQQKSMEQGDSTVTVVLTTRSVWTKR